MCINTGGEKVYPEEVEAVLKSHPSIVDAVVVGVPDPRFGERVAAVLQAVAGGPAPDLDEVQGYCRLASRGPQDPAPGAGRRPGPQVPSGKPDYPWAKEVAGAG